MSRVGGDGFGGAAWQDAWFEAFAPGSPRIPLALDGTDAPVELYEGTVRVCGRPFKFLRAPVNAHTPRYGWGLRRLPTIDALSDSVATALRAGNASGVEVALLSSTGSTFRLLKSLAATGRWAASVTEAEETHVIDTGADWDAYCQSRSRKLIKNLRTRMRQMQGLGNLEFLEVGGQPDWADWFERCLELEASGWKGDAGSAILHQPNEAQFYRKVAEGAARSGRLRLHVELLDARLVAFRFMIQQHDALFAIKIAYDEKYANYSPGSLLLQATVRRCFEDPAIARIDLSGGGAWKRDWATGAEMLMRVRVAPTHSLAGHLLRLENTLRSLRGCLAQLLRRKGN